MIRSWMHEGRPPGKDTPASGPLPTSTALHTSSGPCPSNGFIAGQITRRRNVPPARFRPSFSKGKNRTTY